MYWRLHFELVYSNNKRWNITVRLINYKYVTEGMFSGSIKLIYSIYNLESILKLLKLPIPVLDY